MITDRLTNVFGYKPTVSEIMNLIVIAEAGMGEEVITRGDSPLDGRYKKTRLIIDDAEKFIGPIVEIRVNGEVLNCR